MREKRLAWSLFFAYAWIVVAATAVMWIGNATRWSNGVARRATDHVARLSALLEVPLTTALSSGAGAPVAALCDAWAAETGLRVTVADARGRLLADSHVAGDALEADVVAERMRILQTALDEQPTLTRTVRGQIEVGSRLSANGQVLGYARLAMPLSAAEDRSTGIGVGGFLAIGLLGVASTAGVSLALARRINETLQRMFRGFQRFTEGDLEHRIAADTIEEFSATTEAINACLASLESRIRGILQQQNEQEAMLRSMADGVLAIDRDGQVINLNATCARLLGANADGLKGRLVHEVIRKPDLLRFVEAALENHDCNEGEIQLREPEDRCLHAQSSALYNGRQQRIGALIVLHDVTRIRRLENVRRDFVANVSHELRTPITSIKGFIETLLDGAASEPETAERFLRIVLRQVNRLDAIIEDLLTLSRIEKGSEGRTVRLQRDSVCQVLEAAIEMCSHRSAEKGVTLSLDCDDALEADINATLLEQAVVNLVDNAVKYSASGGSVVVAATREEGRVLIQISDHGCGIEARHLPRLFERFYRVDKARSRELGGTGLGLAIVKHIVLTHRGSVGVESTLGKGSTFSIVLPATQPTMAAARLP